MDKTAHGHGPANQWLILVGLLVAYSPSYINVVLRNLGVDWAFIRGPQSILLWNWVAVALLVLFILRAERLTLRSIGIKPPSGADVSWALTFWGIGSVASMLVASLLPPAPSAGMDMLLALPLPVIIAIIITTGTTEEVLFRGYPVERLGALTGNIWIGVAASALLFILPHIVFFGPTWLLQHGTGLALTYGYYVWRRNLVGCMIIHLLGNSLLLIPALGLA